MTEAAHTKSKRGFASMDSEKRRAIASVGGTRVPAEKRSFSQNAGLASSAGRKGGKAVDPQKRSFAADRSLAVSAGAKGAQGVPWHDPQETHRPGVAKWVVGERRSANG